MAYETRPNTGAFFRNKNKKTDSHPDMSGDAVITLPCPHCHAESNYSIQGSFWGKLTKAGDKWLSASFRLKPDIDQARAAEGQNTSTAEKIDDDLPF